MKEARCALRARGPEPAVDIALNYGEIASFAAQRPASARV